MCRLALALLPLPPNWSSAWAVLESGCFQQFSVECLQHKDEKQTTEYVYFCISMYGNV